MKRDVRASEIGTRDDGDERRASALEKGEHDQRHEHERLEGGPPHLLNAASKNRLTSKLKGVVHARRKLAWLDLGHPLLHFHDHLARVRTGQSLFSLILPGAASPFCWSSVEHHRQGGTR